MIVGWDHFPSPKVQKRTPNSEAIRPLNQSARQKEGGVLHIVQVSKQNEKVFIFIDKAHTIINSHRTTYSSNEQE